MTRRADLRAIDEALIAVGRVGHSRRARRRIEQRSGVPLGPAAVAILAALRAHGPIRYGELARRVGVRPSQLTREARALAEQDLIAERPDPDDRRAVLVELTTAGIDAHRRYRRAAASALADVLTGWPDADVHQLAELLARLAAEFRLEREE